MGFRRNIRQKLVCCLCGAMAALAQRPAEPAKATLPGFCPAYLIGTNPPVLTLFSLDGPAVPVALPADLRRGDIHFLAFGPDGSSFYASRIGAHGRPMGIEKVELKPARHSPVPGSEGMGQVRSLIFEPLSGRILVTGSSQTNGTFEIDPAAGTLRVLRAR